MDDTARARELAELLRDTGIAHHRAFLDTDGFDPEWPLWYARHLHAPLGPLLGTDLTQSEIVFHLLGAERRRSAEDPDAAWADYYAAYLLDADL